MSCKNCEHCIVTRENETITNGSSGIKLTTYTNVYTCRASKSKKRKIGSIYNGLINYNHKIIYSPKWCPLTK